MARPGQTVRMRDGRWLLALQGLALSIAAALFALLPPDHGPILLVSLGGHGASGLIGPDLRLLGKGRLPGSLVVTGAHPAFMGALLDHEVLILPAVPILCGGAGALEG